MHVWNCLGAYVHTQEGLYFYLYVCMYVCMYVLQTHDFVDSVVVRPYDWTCT